jgi:hypothetical protein
MKNMPVPLINGSTDNVLTNGQRKLSPALVKASLTVKGKLLQQVRSAICVNHREIVHMILEALAEGRPPIQSHCNIRTRSHGNEGWWHGVCNKVHHWGGHTPALTGIAQKKSWQFTMEQKCLRTRSAIQGDCGILIPSEKCNNASNIVTGV